MKPDTLRPTPGRSLFFSISSALIFLGLLLGLFHQPGRVAQAHAPAQPPRQLTQTLESRIYLPALPYRVPGMEFSCDDASGYPAGQVHAGVDGAAQQPAGEDPLPKWHPLTISFNGPAADEADENPNPFLDYRLLAILTGPDGEEVVVPGFFAGDGAGYGQGDVWQIRFAPDQEGVWEYCASFRTSPGVAVSLNPYAGVPLAFDGARGQFTVTAPLTDTGDFLSWGRLEAVGSHYLKFRDGPYWIKGGTNSPENFLGYAGFDHTIDQGGIVPDFLHHYAPHKADWQPGDPLFTSEETGVSSKGIIGALNYLAEQHVNSLFFLPLNLGGDGQETYPFISAAGTPYANTHYDVSKLYQWNLVLNHAQHQGIALHIGLNEREPENRAWLDNGTLGVERKLFYREMAARFGYLLALKWNISEENAFPLDQVRAFADYLAAQDWARHPIALHTPPNDFQDYEELLGDPRFTATSIQYHPDMAGEYVTTWRENSSAAEWPWVLDMDENNPAHEGLTPENALDLRRRVLYDVYFSGGSIEWYAGYHELPVGGDMRLEDFRTREEMWRYMWHARDFMQSYLPFWLMAPADHLLDGPAGEYGGGEVFALEGLVYAVYLPPGTLSSTLTITPTTVNYALFWYNPTTGRFTGSPQVHTPVSGTLPLDLVNDVAPADMVALVLRMNAPAEFEALLAPIYARLLPATAPIP